MNEMRNYGLGRFLEVWRSLVDFVLLLPSVISRDCDVNCYKKIPCTNNRLHEHSPIHIIYRIYQYSNVTQ